ncbi:hypothetical protein AE03_00173 [Klebsiella aerogenes MGH 77]|nr:hypothetical protein AE03_00173 [Klebsiella aerogenes MGH 77]
MEFDSMILKLFMTNMENLSLYYPVELGIVLMSSE